MNHEFQAEAQVNNERIPVTVSYWVEGYKPFGLWVFDAQGRDRTLDIGEAAYDELYAKACNKVAEDMTEAAEMACER